MPKGLREHALKEVHLSYFRIVNVRMITGSYLWWKVTLKVTQERRKTLKKQFSRYNNGQKMDGLKSTANEIDSKRVSEAFNCGSPCRETLHILYGLE